MFDIQENLKKLPSSPGVYIHKDKLGTVIYVGKAINLRNRVRQYFQSSKGMPAKVRSMVSQIAEFEYITVSSEMEALILECNLIKKHRPKYNILLRDDKTYPYIKVTGEEWPRILKTRIVKKDGGTYFGPYSDAGAVNTIVNVLNSAFSLKRCSARLFTGDFKPCLNYHINQCRGVCGGMCSKEEYMEAVSGAVDFLKGNDRTLINSLKDRMQEASEALEFEEAARFRDYIGAARTLSETQRVVLHHNREADIVLNVTSTRYVAVFTVREGKLVGRDHFEMDTESSVDDNAKSILAAFINQHYTSAANVPKEILVDIPPEDSKTLELFLSDRAGHSVKIQKPERGEKRALVALAKEDVKELAATIEEKMDSQRQRRESLGREIWDILCDMGAESGDYDGREFRAESYDISNTNGVDTVGAMVVYNGLKPERKSYRKFRVRTVKGQDDYGSMKEVLSRRFLRVLSGDDKFAVIPDIIFMDGGKGHVSVALEVVEAAGFDIPVAGMVKDEHHRTRGLVYRKSDNWEEITLQDKPLLYKYLGNMQEEVHRFAIEYHHKLRSRNIERSVLDEIPGIGPERRKRLLETFGSVEKIKEAAASDDGAEKFAEIRGVDRKTAEKIIEFFSSGNAPS